MAERAAAILAELGLANTSGEPARYDYHVTDMPHRFSEIGRLFLGRPMDRVHLEKL